MVQITLAETMDKLQLLRNDAAADGILIYGKRFQAMRKAYLKITESFDNSSPEAIE